MYNISQTNIFKNWDKDCYIAPKLKSKEDEFGNQINQYDSPKKYKFNYQPVTNQKEAETVAYGDTSNGIVKALIDMKYLNEIKEFDLAYLYGANPTNETRNGANANYRVVTFKPQNTKILVYFEELIKKQGGQYETSKE
jgi:hypothetical protein